MSHKSLLLKSMLWLVLAPFGLAFSASSQAATTYYVRTDGGTAQQCTGRADAPYPGSGSSQACAWKSPHYALPADGATRIQGGDTLIIGPGDYKIGWGAPGAEGGRCYSGGPYDCYLAPVPSGPSASAKTRILGKGHASGCAAPPTLWGTERVWMVLNLRGSDNVEVGCLEITDRSDCVEFHSSAGAECERSSMPYGNWAAAGIAANDSRNVWLHDLNVHGLANTGLQVGGLTDWTVERVKINANGWAGWNGDLGSGSSNSGDIILREVEIAWNGCGERWQTDTPWACWAQQAGGYGDGLGTAKTGGQWLVEDSFIHHNTSDGLDLLYLNGEPGTSVVIRRVHAIGNAGNQLKTTGEAIIENSVVVGNCAYFDGKDFMQAGDQCRAMGNALSVTLSAGQTTTIRHNTITGQGDCLIDSSGGTSSSQLEIRNNVLVGRDDYRGGPGELTCGHYAVDAGIPTSYTGNAFWNVKGGQCPPGNNLCGQNPQLAGMSMENFIAKPLPGSVLIDSAPVIAAVKRDFLMQPRPYGAGPDIGAIEVQPDGSTPPPEPKPEPPPPEPKPMGPPMSDPLPATEVVGKNTGNSASTPSAAVADGTPAGMDPGAAPRPASRLAPSWLPAWLSDLRGWHGSVAGPRQQSRESRNSIRGAAESDSASSPPGPSVQAKASVRRRVADTGPATNHPVKSRPAKTRTVVMDDSAGQPTQVVTRVAAAAGTHRSVSPVVAPVRHSASLYLDGRSGLRAPPIRIIKLYANALN